MWSATPPAASGRLAAGCDMGLVCNDRASAELALAALQRLKVTPPSRLQRMRGKGYANTDYRQQPRWLKHCPRCALRN